MEEYFKQDIIHYSFKKLFKEKVEEEEEKANLKRREEEEKEKLMQQIRINGYLVSQKDTFDIQADLQGGISPFFHQEGLLSESYSTLELLEPHYWLFL
jgi:peptide subunit release factor RF-3